MSVFQSGWEGTIYTNGKPAKIYKATNTITYAITIVSQLVLLTTIESQWFTIIIDFFVIQL